MIRKTKFLTLAILLTFCSQQAETVNQENQTSEEVTTTQLENEESNNTSSTVEVEQIEKFSDNLYTCLLYTSPSPRDEKVSRMPSSA